jgi:photosystem II stability/assembly factor-like uncharacterized protein
MLGLDDKALGSTRSSNLRKKLILAIFGFLLAFLTGVSVYLVKYRVHSPAPTSFRLARIESNSNQPAFTYNRSSLGTDEDLDFIYLVNPKQGWAGTHKGELFKIYDHGKSWERLELPFAGYVSSAYFSSESSGWLLLQRYDPSTDKTKYRGSILYTEDGGRSWGSQFTADSLELIEIGFASPNELWVIGTKFRRRGEVLKAEPFLLRTTNGGSTWNDVSIGLNDGMIRCSGSAHQLPGTIQARGSGTLLLMSDNGWGLSTSDGGIRWQCAGRLETAELRPQRFVRGTKEFPIVLTAVGGSHGTASMLGIKQNDGSWLGSSLSNIFLRDALYLSDNELLACGSLVTDSSSANSTMEGVALVSHDHGMNWSIVYRSSDVTALNALTLREDGEIWAVGANGSLVRFKRAAN